MAKNTANYGNDSIRQLKDEERVRLRPAVIFGSDGLDGCAHAAFEILSNAVDEARQGYGKLITLTAFLARHQRPGLLRDPVRLRIHGRHGLARWQQILPAL